AVAVLTDATDPYGSVQMSHLAMAARKAGASVSQFSHEGSNLDAVLRRIVNARWDALIVVQSPLTVHHNTAVASTALRYRLPLIGRGRLLATARALHAS